MDKKKQVSQRFFKYLAKMKPIACPLCGSGDSAVVGRESRAGLPILSVFCRFCSLIYLNPKPTPETYEEFYASGDYRRFLNMVKGKPHSDNLENYFSSDLYEKKRKRGVELAQTYFSGILGPGDLFFDSGCDFGGTMQGVQETTGCVVMGNEPSRLCAEFIKEKQGVEILNCVTENLSSESIGPDKNKVKVISLIGVLEHMNNPLHGLEIIWNIMGEGGYIYVESFDILKRMESFKECVSDVATIDHQFYFHSKVYCHMIRQAGFEVTRFNYDKKKGRMMQVLARKSEPASHVPDFDVQDIERQTLYLNNIAGLRKKSLLFKVKKQVDTLSQWTCDLAKAISGR